MDVLQPADVSEYVRVFDTTLRDGEQAPGCSMSVSSKIEVATQLRQLNVDVIEAGFPSASTGEVESINAICVEVGNDADSPSICGLARANIRDIDICAEALKNAKYPRIHTFIATSDIHLAYKLRMTKLEVLKTVAKSVTHAKSLCDDVEFSAEDASRSDLNFLYDVLSVAVGCGATTLNIPDTVGYVTPSEYAALIARVTAEFGQKGIIISAHCHDDLGMAVANTLAAVKAGARQVECTINGLGERAGNASLEEVVMALETRKQYFGYSTRIKTQHLVGASQAVSRATGVEVPCNKAIVGANAFAHEAGIHQDGMLKNRETYEIMQPHLVGATTELVLGKHSGKHALAERIKRISGRNLGGEELEQLFKQFKLLADNQRIINDADLEQLIMTQAVTTI